MHRLSLALLLVLAAPAAAQRGDDGAALVGAWQRGWASATSDVESVTMTETAARTMAGPRGTIRVESVARLRVVPGGRIQREVVRMQVNDEVLDAASAGAVEARHARALGHRRGTLRHAPPLAADVLARATPVGARRETMDGARVWRVDLELLHRRRPDADETLPHPTPPRAAAWFADAPTRPRLVRMDLPAGPDGVLRVTYVRIEGLDLPASVEGSGRLRQQRRLRDYAVATRFHATYDGHRIARR